MQDLLGAFFAQHFNTLKNITSTKSAKEKQGIAYPAPCCDTLPGHLQKQEGTMSDEGIWHGSKNPPKKPEPLRLEFEPDPPLGEPLQLDNLGPITNEWELEKQLTEAKRKKDDPWRFFPVMLAAILSAWLIITTAEAIIGAVMINIATSELKKETKKALENLERSLPR